MRILHVGYGFRPFHHGGLIAYAEDLMAAQVARGDEVHYFCTGRHYPLIGPRLIKRKRNGVRIYELLSSRSLIGPVERGTRRPDLDIQEPAAERAFRKVLARVRPDVVHVQEIGGLPSSVLAIPHEFGVPVLMTLQDYFPLCPTVKLFDVHGQLCLRPDPAPVCIECCRDAPGRSEAIVATLGHHRRTIDRHVPLLSRLPGPRTVARRLRTTRAGGDGTTSDTGAPRAPAGGDVDGFRARRRLNVRRLNDVDRLVAMSPRVAEIYTALGVEPARLHTMRLTLSHIDGLRPRRLDRIDGPVRFVTLNGAATVAKGSGVVADAVDELVRMGFTAADLTLSIGGVPDPAVAERLRAAPFVEILGGYTASGVDAMLDPFHVGIVPSIWEEAYGYVGVEMLAKGLPVIGNAVGGIPEYTRDGETGWLNHDATGHGLARLMAEIVRDPEQIVARNRILLEQRAELILPIETHAHAMNAAYAETVSQSARDAASVG